MKQEPDHKRPWLWVWAAALILTGLNAVKPLCIDDTAYFYFARQAYEHPSDPYGFSILWHQYLRTANHEVGPPVLSYWWAIAMALFGDVPVAWKLWMFPFAFLLCFSTSELLRCFKVVPHTIFLCMVVLSPWVLPAMNLMQDIPVQALCLCCLVLFIKGCENNGLRHAVATGIVLGMAMETKYTALVFPAVLFAWAATMSGTKTARMRHLALWLVATVIAFGLFAVFEYWTALLYGTSHFMMKLEFPLAHSSLFRLAITLPSILGAIAPFLMMAGMVALGLNMRWLLVPVFLIALQYGMYFSPELFELDTQYPLRVPFVCEQLLGAGFLYVLGMLVVRQVRAGSPIKDRTTIFLLAWCGIEITGYFLISPFPAVRRVMGLCIATGFLVGRLLTRRDVYGKRLLCLIATGQMALSLLFCYVDWLGAKSEQDLAVMAVQKIHATYPGATVWFTGHWGFQFYAEQAGMQAVAPERSIIHANDFMVVPHGIAAQTLVIPDTAHIIGTVAINDNVPMTARKYYSGDAPVGYRDILLPRFSADIYHTTKSFVAAP